MEPNANRDVKGVRGEAEPVVAHADAMTSAMANATPIRGAPGPPGPARRRPVVWTRLATVAVLGVVVLVSHWLPAARADFPSILPPLFVRWIPLITPAVIVPVALGIAFVVGLPALMRAGRTLFLASLVAFVFGGSIALALQDLHPRLFTGCCESGGLSAVLAGPLERPQDYLSNVPLVRRLGPVETADAYPWLARPDVGRLSLRAMTHPPGAVLMAWILDGAAHDDAAVVALLIVAIGALGVVPTYLVAREVWRDESTARTAAVLFATCPIVLLYTATAFDAAFMTVGAFAMAALAAAPRRAAWAVAGGAVSAGAVTLTYGLFSLAPLGAGLFLMAARRVRPRDLLLRAAAAVASFAMASWLLYRYAGMHMLASFETALRVQHQLADLRLRSFWYWTLGGSVIAFLIAAGLGLSTLFVVQTVRAWRVRRPGLETVVWAAMIASSAAGVLRGETEHLWMYFIPVLAAAAAPAAVRLRREAGFGLAQAGVTQVLVWTNW